MKHKNFNLSVIASVVLLTACGSSGSGDPVAEPTATPSATATPSPSETPTPPSSGTPTPAPMPTPNPTPSPQPTPPAPTPTPTACISAPTPTTGYSLVFKGCSATNVAEYYDKTECVRDNATGLIWQGQTAAGTGLRANDVYKTNFDSLSGNQNASIGNPIPATQLQIDASTNAIGFKTAVNATNLCNSASWRLPTVNELLGIVKSNETPKIDNAWFANAVTNYYWTSSPASVPFDDLASVVDFSSGLADNRSRDGSSAIFSHTVLVRLVRQ